jgi:serine/threonine protein kinase
MPYQRLQIGDRTGEYILEVKVGHGPETEVWKAKHHVLASPGAVKVAYSETGAASLQRAGVAQHTLRHPRVARILGLNLENDPPYLVTEFIGGESLYSLMERESPLPWERFAGIFRDILEGLAFVHEAGKVHGNLKPKNVLLNEEGRAVLTDFGARRIPDVPDSMLSGVLSAGDGATVVFDPYLPPEGREEVAYDARCDVWSAGLILFEALTGKRPEGSEGPRDLVRGLPGEVEAAFRGAYTRPKKRFPSANEMSRTLFGEAEVDIPVARDVQIVSAVARCACGYDNRVEYRYCVKCGARLGAPIPKPNADLCASCGKPRRSAYKFCPFCGGRY